ncbi:unnamed protein product [Gongylonema pulchrum]|uniref:BACK domain-containing protein n=1 Tax=Gongylonema pulchrum TaxID=637853 RepID=A0A183CZY8_9BILA|nr:unnamed protein product [Gongylonema pulchrum]
MLDIASYLLVDPLLALLSDLIVSKVNASTLVYAYHKAEYRYVPLAEKLWKIIVQEYDRLVQNNTYLMLHLNIDKQYEVEMVRQWIAANENGDGSVAKLREELLDVDELAGFSKDARLPNSILIASGGWSNTGPTALVEAFDSRTQQWVRSKLKLFETPRAYHAVINTHGYLYTIGGFNGDEYYRTTRKFSMNSRRCYLACTLLDPDQIIAVGGYNNMDRLKSAEIFHLPTNQWRKIAKMSFKRFGLEATEWHYTLMELNGFVYAVGGFDGMNCHESVEYYDPHGNRWFTMGSDMSSRRSGVRVTKLHGVMVVCGGFDGTNRLKTCEFIDSREGRWHTISPMNRTRSVNPKHTEVCIFQSAKLRKRNTTGHLISSS